MTVTLSQDTYDAMIEDVKKLRKERDENQEMADAYREILDINVDKDEYLCDEYIDKVNGVIENWMCGGINHD